MEIIRLDPTATGYALTVEECDLLAVGKAKLHTIVGAQPGKEIQSLKLNSNELKEYELIKLRGFFLVEKKVGNKLPILGHRVLEALRVPKTRIERAKTYSKIVMDLLCVSKEKRDAWDKQPHTDPPQTIGGRTRYWGCFNVIERVPAEHDIACVEWLLSRYRVSQ